MAAKPLPSAVYLRALFRYEPETGRLYWRTRYDAPPRWNARYAGRRAGSRRGGRWRIMLPGGATHAAARVIWKMVRQREPAVIDHINGDPLDDRIENLRPATHAQNARNSRGHSASGFKGVTFGRSSGKWTAKIWIAGRTVFLGNHDDPAEAHAAYMCAARKHFGVFARADCAPARQRRK